ncbi:tigger transposable element-derived protein 4-like [Dreissena polymorpha]|uniref:tigger transposable element-derived protein 4-like n=1 Tax=Dreissena polymorpha TaxID=45954 RepID=UPI0022648AB4|nr:tigger transposable element-derived protein 4-like [Dreissena polymorpha]
MSDTNKSTTLLFSQPNVKQSGEGPGTLPGRISGSAVNKKGVKRRHKSKSYKEKYEAIMEVEKGEKSKKQIADVFGARGAKCPKVESALLTWFKNKRQLNLPISGDDLKEKAKEFASQLGVSSAECEFSSGWLDRFKLRHGIVCKTVSGEAGSVDTTTDAFRRWQMRLKTILSETSPDDIFHADETAIFFRALPEKTLEFKRTSCHGPKVNKVRLTALVCANMSGTYKMPLLVLGRSQNPRCFKHVKSLPVQYKANKKAWMTSEIFKEWVRKVDGLYRKKNRKIIIIVDNCPAHPEVSNLRAVTLVFLPPNTTSILQPMDQGIIRSLKIGYRKRVVLKKLKALDADTTYRISILDSLHMMKAAWNDVKSTTNVNCYRRAGLVPVSEPSKAPVAEDDEDDPDDDIPLASLAAALGTTTMDQYIDVDIDIPATENIDEDDIINDLIGQRSADAVEDEPSDDDEADNTRTIVISNRRVTTCINDDMYVSLIGHSD